MKANSLGAWAVRIYEIQPGTGKTAIPVFDLRNVEYIAHTLAEVSGMRVH
jgi:hypothetical protein